jgi:hypothetical protein
VALFIKRGCPKASTTYLHIISEQPVADLSALGCVTGTCSQPMYTLLLTMGLPLAIMFACQTKSPYNNQKRGTTPSSTHQTRTETTKKQNLPAQHPSTCTPLCLRSSHNCSLPPLQISHSSHQLQTHRCATLCPTLHPFVASTSGPSSTIRPTPSWPQTSIPPFGCRYGIDRRTRWRSVAQTPDASIFIKILRAGWFCYGAVADDDGLRRVGFSDDSDFAGGGRW